MTESGPSKSQWEIWCTNGTEDGTKRVCSGERFKLHAGIIAFKGHLIFSGYEHLSERSLSPIRIYKLDGTSGQISVLKDVPGTSAGIDYLFVHDRFLYFCTSINRQTTIWRTDGSTAGTIPIQQFSNTAYLHAKFFSWQGKTWFVGGSSENGATLWQTDGSPEGTRPWIEGCSKSPAGSFSHIGDFFCVSKWLVLVGKPVRPGTANDHNNALACSREVRYRKKIAVFSGSPICRQLQQFCSAEFNVVFPDRQR